MCYDPIGSSGILIVGFGQGQLLFCSSTAVFDIGNLSAFFLRTSGSE